MAQDGAQGSPVEHFVIRDDDLREGGVSPQDNMAALLALKIEAGAFQGFNAFPAGDDRQFAHTVTISAPEVSGGTGRLSSFRVST